MILAAAGLRIPAFFHRGGGDLRRSCRIRSNHSNQQQPRLAGATVERDRALRVALRAVTHLNREAFPLRLRLRLAPIAVAKRFT